MRKSRKEPRISNSEQPALVTGRVASVDALRGFDMFWIIGGGALLKALVEIWENPVTETLKQQLRHVKWEGFHAWDLIMPLFLFIVGVAIPFSFNKRLARGDGKRKLYFHIVKRVVILSVLGIVAQGDLLAYDISNLRIYGYVLGAIAAGYFVSSIIVLNMRIVWQMITTAGLMLLFWALMSWVPVPGGPGGTAMDGNLAFYLDKLLLGRLHQARVLKLSPSLQGMITKAKDYITWGEVDAETMTLLLAKRGRLPGNKRLDDGYVKKNSSHSTIKALAKAIAEGKASVGDVTDLKPVFRLSPPRKGYRGKRHLPIGMGGVTGYRGTEINDLARKMI